MAIAEFIIRDVFSAAPVFLALIATLGLCLQKKPAGEVLTGALKTALGAVLLQQGVAILIDSFTPLAGAFAIIFPATWMPEVPPSVVTENFMAQHSMEIGVAMLLGFILNLLIARYTKWKTVFLTGHMLFWFPYVTVAVAVNNDLSTLGTIFIATVFTTAYYVIAPNLARPWVRKVTGNDEFTLGHPSVLFVIIGGFFAEHFGDKKKSTEDIKLPKGLLFLKEIALSGAVIMMLMYVVITVFFSIKGYDYSLLYGLDTTKGIFQFIFVSGLAFGAGLTVLLLGVRLIIAEIIPAFVGIQEKLIPDAIPAYDCPLLFTYAPNAVIIGFVVSLFVSTITLIAVSALGIFKYTIIPVVITCFFENGAAAVVGNAVGGRRGAIIASAINGVLMIFLMGFSLYFVDRTIVFWMLGSGGQDFSVLAIMEGLILKLLGH